VSRQILLLDVGLAVLLAVLVLIVSPGVAVSGMIALFVVLVCAVSFGIERRRGRRVAPPRGADSPRRGGPARRNSRRR
jgi:hypothetical protein